LPEGCLRAALDVIWAGATDPIAAAHVLFQLFNDDSSPQEFAREGTMRSLVRLCCDATCSRLGYMALKACLSTSPEAVTQYIAEFFDADPHNVVAAVITLARVLGFGSRLGFPSPQPLAGR
jgi:hypothetical protein